MMHLFVHLVEVFIGIIIGASALYIFWIWRVRTNYTLMAMDLAIRQFKQIEINKVIRDSVEAIISEIDGNEQDNDYI